MNSVPLLRAVNIWWNPAQRPDQPSLWDSKIELSEKFFNEIIRQPGASGYEHPHVPQTLLRWALISTLWLTYRTFTLRASLRLSWPQLYRQFGSNPNNVATRQSNRPKLPP